MDRLKSCHHVLTYVGLGNLNDDGWPMEGAFLKTDWSANWLEYFPEPKDNQVAKARRGMSTNLTLGKNGCLAELNVGESCRRVKDNTEDSIFYERDPQPGNLSHCEARGMPPNDTERQYAVAAELAESVVDVHSTV